MCSGFWCVLFLIREMAFLGETYPFWCFCLLGKSEVTGMLLALSPFVGKAKLVKLELKSWVFFPFHLRKKCTINTSGSGQAYALTEITVNWWNKLFGKLFIINGSYFSIPSKWGKKLLSSNQIALHWTSYHWCHGVFCLIFLFFPSSFHFFKLSHLLLLTK